MKGVGFRAGYHPPPAVLSELRIIDKKRRRYADRAGNEYSSRAVQEAKAGYVSLEIARDLRKQGWRDVLNFKQRKEHPIALAVLLRKWAQKNELPQDAALKSKRFRKDVASLIHKITREAPDEDYYDEVEEFLEDTFDMQYEEIGFYY